MGSTASNLLRTGSGRQHHPHHPFQPHHQRPHHDMHSAPYVFAAATPYPPPPQQQPYQHYPGYYPGPPPAMPPPPLHYPYVEHQKAVTIRNDVNIKKDTLSIVPDQDNPGKFLVCFTFDATASGSLSIFFFAKEGAFCSLTPVKETLLEPVTVQFQKGLSQKFKQPIGTGLDLSMFEEAELAKASDAEVYPLSVMATVSLDNDVLLETGNQQTGSTNSQITQAVFEKEEGAYRVRVVKQFLFVNGTRYELQEIYGIRNSVGDDLDGNDPGKECVICLSEPRSTTVLPCRHMCMCSGCAAALRFQTNRCPICRQPVKHFMEIDVNNSNHNGTGE